MKVLFIYYSDFCKSSIRPIANLSNIQLGISYLSSVLKRENNETDLFILKENTSIKRVLNYVKKYMPALICFHYPSELYSKIPECARMIKRHFSNIFVIAGGIFPTFFPEKTLHSGFDGACRGDGEYPILQLVEKINKNNITNIPNFWFKKGNKIEKNFISSFTDYNKVPPPDWELWNKYLWNKKEFGTILVGIGCPFNCSYCLNAKLKKIIGKNQVRLRSPDVIIKEIQSLIKFYPNLRQILLQAETIGSDVNYLKDLSQKLKNFNENIRNKITYTAHYRISNNASQDKILSYLKQANITSLDIGIESGSQRIREKILNRFYSNESITKFSKKAKKVGIKINAFILLGLPTETTADFRETILLLKKIRPDKIFQSIYFPYPGTELYERFPPDSPFNKNYKFRQRFNPIIENEGFSKKKVQKEFILLSYRVQKDYKPIYYILKDIISRAIYSNNFLYIILYNFYLHLNSVLYLWIKLKNGNCDKK